MRLRNNGAALENELLKFESYRKAEAAYIGTRSYSQVEDSAELRARRILRSFSLLEFDELSLMKALRAHDGISIYPHMDKVRYAFKTISNGKDLDEFVTRAILNFGSQETRREFYREARARLAHCGPVAISSLVKQGHVIESTSCPESIQQDLDIARHLDAFLDAESFETLKSVAGKIIDLGYRRQFIIAAELDAQIYFGTSLRELISSGFLHCEFTSPVEGHDVARFLDELYATDAHNLALRLKSEIDILSSKKKISFSEKKSRLEPVIYGLSEPEYHPVRDAFSVMAGRSIENYIELRLR